MQIREVRILIQWRGSLRKLCKIAFSSSDASLYLFPYAVQGKYYYGSNTIPAQQASLSFDFTDDIFKKETPKLSIHETGQVHVCVGDSKAGPLYIPELKTFTGQHIASVCPDSFLTLPIFTGKLREKGSKIDHIIPAVDGAINGRLAIYLNGTQPMFCAQNCRLIFPRRSPTLKHPLYFCAKPIVQPPIGTVFQEGVTIIAGWNPMQPITEDVDFLFIRGK